MFKSYRDLPPAPIASIPVSDVNKTGRWRAFKPLLDENKCIKCYFCWKFCPDVCISIEKELPKINYDYCKGCGICANECKPKAIKMVEE
ncbi:MAG: 4Fe-4S binding protein [Candidatus Thermoplasmatota archaeon]